MFSYFAITTVSCSKAEADRVGSLLDATLNLQANKAQLPSDLTGAQKSLASIAVLLSIADVHAARCAQVCVDAAACLTCHGSYYVALSKLQESHADLQLQTQRQQTLQREYRQKTEEALTRLHELQRCVGLMRACICSACVRVCHSVVACACMCE